MNEIWTNLSAMSEPWPEKVIRTVAVYLFLLALLRLAGKRELGNASTADLIVILLISNTVQNAIIGDETSLIGGIAGALILVLLNHGFAKYEYVNHRFMHLVEGEPAELIRDGKVVRETQDREKITDDELIAACRTQNVDGIARVKLATLETNGMITIVPEDPPDVVTERLNRIEEALGELLSRTEPGSGARLAT
jgi:uncharacterized membrane protein YcaP (DUF421 family)